MRFAARSFRYGMVLGLLGSLLGAAVASAARQDGTPAATPVPSDPAVAHCLARGGIVRERVPVWGTNLPEDQQIRLANPRLFCEFTGGAQAEPAESWISVDVDTLFADGPTLAALAYLTRPPLPEVRGSVNPSTVYCLHLGGAYDFGGTSAAGGGWVTSDTDTPIDVLNACVFPDGSMIDAWGITYHADGTIRGADLTPLFRYQPDNPPNVFPGA